MLSTLFLAAAVLNGNFANGNTLYATCTGSDLDQVACRNYVMGAIDMMTFYEGIAKPRVICLPIGFTAEQGKDIVLKYLRDHPEKRHYAAGSLIVGALMADFVCKS